MRGNRFTTHTGPRPTQTVRTVGPTGREIDGLQRITGVVNPKPPLDIFGLLTRDAMSTLHLEDGRRWEFAFKDNGGNAVNRSGRGFTKA